MIRKAYRRAISDDYFQNGVNYRVKCDGEIIPPNVGVYDASRPVTQLRYFADERAKVPEDISKWYALLSFKLRGHVLSSRTRFRFPAVGAPLRCRRNAKPFVYTVLWEHGYKNSIWLKLIYCPPLHGVPHYETLQFRGVTADNYLQCA